jgi:hypothetical protein
MVKIRKKESADRKLKETRTGGREIGGGSARRLGREDDGGL